MGDPEEESGVIEPEAPEPQAPEQQAPEQGEPEPPPPPVESTDVPGEPAAPWLDSPSADHGTRRLP